MAYHHLIRHKAIPTDGPQQQQPRDHVWTSNVFAKGRTPGCQCQNCFPFPAFVPMASGAMQPLRWPGDQPSAVRRVYGQERCQTFCAHLPLAPWRRPSLHWLTNAPGHTFQVSVKKMEEAWASAPWFYQDLCRHKGTKSAYKIGASGRRDISLRTKRAQTSTSYCASHCMLQGEIFFQFPISWLLSKPVACVPGL